MKKPVILGVLGVLALMLSGCSAEYWTGKTTMRTELSGPGWHFIDTKDNDIELDDASFDPTTKSGKIGKLVIRNNASDPITAEIARIEAIGQAQMSQVAYVSGLLQGLSNMISAAGTAAPGFSWLKSTGGGGGISIPTSLGELGITTGGTNAWTAPDQTAVAQAQIEAQKAYLALQQSIVDAQKKVVTTQPAETTGPTIQTVLDALSASDAQRGSQIGELSNEIVGIKDRITVLEQPTSQPVTP